MAKAGFIKRRLKAEEKIRAREAAAKRKHKPKKVKLFKAPNQAPGKHGEPTVDKNFKIPYWDRKPQGTFSHHKVCAPINELKLTQARTNKQND